MEDYLFIPLESLMHMNEQCPLKRLAVISPTNHIRKDMIKAMRLLTSDTTHVNGINTGKLIGVIMRRHDGHCIYPDCTVAHNDPDRPSVFALKKANTTYFLKTRDLHKILEFEPWLKESLETINDRMRAFDLVCFNFSGNKFMNIENVDRNLRLACRFRTDKLPFTLTLVLYKGDDKLTEFETGLYLSSEGQLSDDLDLSFDTMTMPDTHEMSVYINPTKYRHAWDFVEVHI